MYNEVVFDMEVFPKWWCMVYTDPDDMSKLNVLSSDDTDYKKTIRELIYRRCLIGFNIKNYDLRILQAIKDGCDPYRIYEVSKAIIEEREDYYNSYNYWNNFIFSDLYDDWKKGSLKEFESNIGMSIKESDISFEKENLTDEDKIETIKYCKHDVEATIKLLEFRREYIDSKKVLSELFNIPLHTALKSTNAKLAAIILKAKPKYRISNYNFIIPDKVKPYIESNLPKDVIDLFSVLNDEQKTVNLFENEINFGIGGIHSVYAEHIIVKEDDKYVLKNIDVTSYYPNLMMLFDYMSRNVIDKDIYKKIYDMRVDLKKQAGIESKENGKTEKWKLLNAQQTALKLILNTVYGAMKNKYNALYDEYQASSLCYLGQLLLASLANKLYNTIDDLKVIQTNTDGILIKVPRDKCSVVEELVHEWEDLTGFTMEFDDIKLFYQNNVNNYIEVTNNPKKPYKLKGKWCNQAEGCVGDANLNAPVVHEAILKYYTENVPIRETIYHCNDIVNFCFTTKTTNKYEKTYHTVNNELLSINKVNRVVATTDKRYGTIKKYKKVLKTVDGKDIWADQYDKVAEIPENCYLMNDDLYMLDTLDRDWYVSFAENRMKEFTVV